MPRVAKVRNGQAVFQVTVHQGRVYCGVRLRLGPMDHLARGARRAGFEAAVRVFRRSVITDGTFRTFFSSPAEAPLCPVWCSRSPDAGAFFPCRCSPSISLDKVHDEKKLAKLKIDVNGPT